MLYAIKHTGPARFVCFEIDEEYRLIETHKVERVSRDQMKCTCLGMRWQYNYMTYCRHKKMVNMFIKIRPASGRLLVDFYNGRTL